MHPRYADIRDAIDREPDWFDERGVPRYAPFRPNMLGVYDKYALCVEIGCQGCDEKFIVGAGINELQAIMTEGFWMNLGAWARGYHYGDPPSHRGCVGETMNSIPLRIIEAWSRPVIDWRHHDELRDLNIRPDWAD